MKPVRAALVGLAVLVTSLFAGSVPAFAATIHVGPGQSIQAAVDSAQPGDTIVVAPGVYQESVEIREDDLTILGAGSGEGGTVLEPPATVDNVCTQNAGGLAGFCVVGTLDSDPPEPFEPGGPVVLDTVIEGFQIRGFESGVLLYRARFSRLADLGLVDNDEYGLFSVDSQSTRITDSSATGNGEAGFYIGDTRNSAAGITDSVATGNGIGIFLRDATQGRVSGNIVRDNCVGLMALDTGSTPIGVNRWVIRGNIFSRNNAVCAANEQSPPLSGAGVVLIGARKTIVSGNQANNNRPAGPSFVGGGIMLASGEDAGGAVPTGNRVNGNTAHNNSPADLVYDGSGSNNQFADNDCGSSQPSGLCG
ncbi:MAG: right-handed parallel beta-helix repeat-containing protein [Actinomycetota bacterium]